MIDGKGLTRRRAGRWVFRRRRIPWRLRGFAACPPCVPGRFRALEKGPNVGGREVRGSVAPPGLGQRIGKGRRGRGVSGSNPVLVREFSIPMPMPIPIPTRASRGCRVGSSSAGGVSVRRLRRMGTVSSYDVLRFLRPSWWDCGQRVSREGAKGERNEDRMPLHACLGGFAS